VNQIHFHVRRQDELSGIMAEEILEINGLGCLRPVRPVYRVCAWINQEKTTVPIGTE